MNTATPSSRAEFMAQVKARIAARHAAVQKLLEARAACANKGQS